ncbi:cytochrome c1 [Candidatus Halobeggiatoa sp. HSG11]|nr:cytochrome c1 [Candidatus Halobeggiatoa sp. HSG11]
MKRLIITLILILPSIGFAAGGGVALQSANNDLTDNESLKAGAKLFIDYCMGCHSADYVRFQRVGKDIGISDEELLKDFMFSADKVGETMSIAMDKEDAEKWFGVIPPDLSVIARARGTDWLYTYLMTFYLDSSRPFGVNNLAFPDVGMPHVMWDIQGWQEPVYEEKDGHKVITSLKLIGPKDKAEQYKTDVRNLVNFLEYIGEPAKLHRLSLGWKVIAFLFIFLIFAILLKKEYWRDVH